MDVLAIDGRIPLIQGHVVWVFGYRDVSAFLVRLDKHLTNVHPLYIPIFTSNLCIPTITENENENDSFTDPKRSVGMVTTG